jgi:LEA14-like dessication related protein
MNKAVGISVSILIVFIVIIGGLIAYSYTQLNVSLNNVTLHSVDLESLSLSNLLKLGLNAFSGNWVDAAFDLIQGINFNLTFGFSNNGLFPVYVPDLSYDLLINDIPIGSGNSKIDTTIYPGQTKEIFSFQNIKKNSLLPTIYSIIDTRGMIDLKVKGTAYFNLLGFSIPISFESSKQISIYDEVRNKISAEVPLN